MRSATTPSTTSATAHSQYMPVTNMMSPSTTPRMMMGPCLGTFATSSRSSYSNSSSCRFDTVFFFKDVS